MLTTHIKGVLTCPEAQNQHNKRKIRNKLTQLQVKGKRTSVLLLQVHIVIASVQVCIIDSQRTLILSEAIFEE
jgi:hypothetical protein